MNRDIIWASLAWPSIIVHQSKTSPKEHIEQGFAAGRTDQRKSFAYEYIISVKNDWSIKNVSITDRLNNRSISLRHKNGEWHDTALKKHLVEFDGVPFIDISISPFTNTLPIKQLAFKTSQPQKIDTIYFDENNFSLRKVQQIYSKLGDATYRYEDIEVPNFTARLIVDQDGLIVEYEHLFKRI